MRISFQKSAKNPHRILFTIWVKSDGADETMVGHIEEVVLGTVKTPRKEFRIDIKDVYFTSRGEFRGVSTPINPCGGIPSVRRKTISEAKQLASQLAYKRECAFGEYRAHLKATQADDADLWRKLLKVMEQGGISVLSETGAIYVHVKLNKQALIDKLKAYTGTGGIEL